MSSAVIAVPLTLTPSSEGDVSSLLSASAVILRVNSATCFSSSLSSDISLSEPSIAFLLISIVEISSVTMMLFPSGEEIVFPSDSTEGLFLITPFSTVNLNSVVTFWYPSGEAFSTRIYSPSLRPTNVSLFDLNVYALSE